MKRWPLVLILLAACGRSSERAGNFTIHSVREEFAGHSHTTMSLTYHGRTLSERLSDWTVDPRNPDRIVFASYQPCGTFLFDGARSTIQLDAGADVVHASSDDDSINFAGSSPWSPNGAYVWIGNDVAEPVVVEIRSGAQLDLTDALSADRRRLSVEAYQWAPSSDRVAVVVQPGGFNDPDRDLAVITLSPLHADYAATMRGDGGRLMWTTSDFHWDGDALVANDAGRNGAILRRPPNEIRWTATRPRGPTPRRKATCG